MLEFPCGNCGMRIKVDERQRGEKILCTNCNTRQIVPDDAMPAFETVPPPAPGARPAVPEPPPYILLEIAGWILTGLGLLACAIFVILAFTDIRNGSLAFLLTAASSIVVAGLGQLMLAVRDIAQSAWHLRPKNS